MKKYVTYAVAVFFATTLFGVAAGADKDAIKAQETAAWQAFKDKNADGFKKVIDKDFRGVYADGMADMAKELSDMKKWDMKSFAISNYTAFSDEKDVIVTTYTVKLDGTFNGQDASGTYNAGSVWKLENGAWLAIFHTNVKQEKAAK
jgi:hypothetical protein